MTSWLPAGPARTRASDQDRERVVAFIRGHWSHGRLTDEELERRSATRWRRGGRLSPGVNRRFIVAQVLVVNRGSAPRRTRSAAPAARS